MTDSQPNHSQQECPIDHAQCWLAVVNDEYNTDQSDLNALLELLDENSWDYRWEALKLNVNEWWHGNRKALGAMLIVAVITALSLWAASNVGARRMENAMTCPFDDQVRTVEGYCVNPEMYVDDYIDQLPSG